MHAHRALPLLLRMCAAIDRLFIAEVGPPATALVEAARSAWLEGGNRLRPADVEQYIALLAANIRDAERRGEFVSDARACIRL
jgi:hypothetical protein